MHCLYVCYYAIGGGYGIDVWPFPHSYCGRPLACNESHMLIDAW